MSLAPILAADPIVQFHILAALTAIGLVPFALFRRRRDRVHKIAGYAWVSAMLATALSSFWISGIRLIGPFSPIHVLSLYTLFGVVMGVVQIRRGDRHSHEATMKAIAFWALGVAGLLTLLPGRLMNRALFGEAGEAGFSFVLVVAVLLSARAGLLNKRSQATKS